jgi:hypothetical protein
MKEGSKGARFICLTTSVRELGFFSNSGKTQKGKQNEEEEILTNTRKRIVYF